MTQQANRENQYDTYRLTPRRVGTAARQRWRRQHIARAAAKSIVVATSGGKLEETFTAAYYKPFTAKTGIEIVKR